MKFILPISFFLAVAVVSSSYAPEKTRCPTGRLVREAKGISQKETDWVAKKGAQLHLKRFLESSNLEDFDAETFLANSTDHPIEIGLAFSGGGHRAMLCGAGFMAALDNRTIGAHEKGLGGLLQAATYMSGLSGGSWLVGSVVFNNYTSIQDIIDGKTNIWDLTYSIFDSKGSGVFNLLKYYFSLLKDVLLKHWAGFQVTLTDIWARALSHHFFGGANFGDDLRWSETQNIPAFATHEMPFPIIVANARNPGAKNVDPESPIVEINPFELGSWDPALNSFTETTYLGTEVNDGMPTSQTCYKGFDNSGFVLGTSSTLFNEIFGNEITQNIEQNTTIQSSLNSTARDDLNAFLNATSNVDHSIAAYKPNPFRNVTEASNKNLTGDDTLSLVDGGEDLQNVPLYPLVQKSRNVDIIFAYDSSADTYDDWPSGAAMQQVYERQFTPQGKSMSVPKIPNSDTFMKEGLTHKPVFFGCSAADIGSAPADLNAVANETSTGPRNTTEIGNSTEIGDLVQDEAGKKPPPLIVYVANRKLSFDSNKSTFTFVYNDPTKLSMIKNGFEVASRNNGTEDSNWRTCVSCAIIRREQERRGVVQSEQCKKCFQEYCWKG